MSKKTYRVNEINYNNFGSKMEIISYRGRGDMDVYFEEYNWTAKHVAYKEFNLGTIKCPYEPRTCKVGYLGEGKYTFNNRNTKSYPTWRNMLSRCYNETCLSRNKTYKNCTVCEEWHNFQNFAKWYEDNYYEIPNEMMELDKDILYKGNKTYSPETCVFVPNNINTLFVGCDISRGAYPIGVTFCKSKNKFQAQCQTNNGNRIMLGCFDDSIDAFNYYKKHKELTIKQVADKYKNHIPKKLYDALYKYEVEITD